MKQIENTFTKNQVVIPTANTPIEAVKIFDDVYSKGYFQLQTSQVEHQFFEPFVYKLRYEALEPVEGRKNKKRQVYYFYSVENLLKLKTYGCMYIDRQIETCKNDKHKTAEEKDLFEKNLKKYKSRLIDAIDAKLEYVQKLCLLSKFDNVKHRKLLKASEVDAALEKIKTNEPDKYARAKENVKNLFAENLVKEQSKIDKAMGIEHKRKPRKKADDPVVEV